MFVRSILIPALLVCAIAAPFLLSQHGPSPSAAKQTTVEATIPGHTVGFPANGTNTFLPSTGVSSLPAGAQNVSVNTQNAPLGDVQSSTTVSTANPARPLVPFGLVSQPTNTSPLPFASGVPVNTFAASAPPLTQPNGFAVGRPDPLAAQTVVYPGNQFGPDLTAQPLEFLPITDLNQIFRFDVTQGWITQSWKRVSTNHGDRHLRGFRVALVTGTNSWDLHGSLTYYFDKEKRAQKITFRGWTGDASRLTALLTNRYNFESQSTHLAGFYLARSWGRSKGGMLMKHPDIIYQENPVQRLAILLEINNPEGKILLSPEFESLIAGSHGQ